jgi:hypothetical protein
MHIIRWQGFLFFCPRIKDLLVLIHISGSIQNNKVDQFLTNSFPSLPSVCQTTPTYSQYLISSHCTNSEPGALLQPLPFRFYFRQISLFTSTVHLYGKATRVLSHYTIILK